MKSRQERELDQRWDRLVNSVELVAIAVGVVAVGIILRGCG